MEYVVVGFMCIVIGYGIGIAHHVRQLEAEIKLRHEWESMAKGLVQAAAEYDVVANNNTQQLKAEICHCEPVYPKIAVEGLIEIGFPFCPRCGGKYSRLAHVVCPLRKF